MKIRIAFLMIACGPCAQHVLAQDAPATTEAADASAAAATTESESASASSSAPRVMRADRLDLDTTVVTGNRELPKVLYIVPWKKAELGELPAQPFNTLLDEVLAPVDREEFRREVKYYGTLAEKKDPAAGEKR